MSYLKLSWNTLLKASACSYPSSWQSGMIDSKMLIRVFIVASKLSKLKSRSYLVYLYKYTTDNIETTVLVCTIKA